MHASFPIDTHRVLERSYLIPNSCYTDTRREAEIDREYRRNRQNVSVLQLYPCSTGHSLNRRGIVVVSKAFTNEP